MLVRNENMIEPGGKGSIWFFFENFYHCLFKHHEFFFFFLIWYWQILESIWQSFISLERKILAWGLGFFCLRFHKKRHLFVRDEMQL